MAVNGKRWPQWLVYLALLHTADAFSFIHGSKKPRISRGVAFISRKRQTSVGRHDGQSPATSLTRLSALENIELILLDLPLDETNDESFLLPLPSDHLPRELSTSSVYGMQLSLPLHQLILQQAKEQNRGIFGQVAFKQDSDSWVGAIGCAAQVLLLDKGEGGDEPELENEGTTSAGPKPHMALVQGKWRFIVKEVKSTIPYPVVLVDELEDGQDDKVVSSAADKDSIYASLTPSELVDRLLEALKTLSKQQLAALERNEVASPLEQSIVEGLMDLSMQRAAEKRAAEEMAAIVDVVSVSLEDFCPTPQEQYYSLGFLAAELAGFSNDVRKECLVMLDSVQRMRFVLSKLDEQISRQQAISLTELITKQQDDDEKDLKVGVPTLPAWARQIRKGMKLEYYWNEEWDWCEGEVVEDPLFVVDEVILTVYFPMDGTTHRLPITADEKARWRPVR